MHGTGLGGDSNFLYMSVGPWSICMKASSPYNGLPPSVGGGARGHLAQYRLPVASDPDAADMADFGQPTCSHCDPRVLGVAPLWLSAPSVGLLLSSRGGPSLTLPRINAGDSRRTLVAPHYVRPRRFCPAPVGPLTASPGERSSKTTLAQARRTLSKNASAFTRGND